MSEKVADDFLNALFSTIQDGLVRDGNVCINGLGAFRVQDVPARQSVNVATGERITINGYKKIVFTEAATPDATGASSSARSRKKKAEEPIDPLQKLGEQAEEIKGILSELNAMGAEGATLPSTDATEPTEKEETVVSTDTTKTTKTTKTTEKAPVPQQPNKPFNAWLTGLITVGVFAMLLVVAYFVLRHQIIRWADNMRATVEQRIATPAEEQQPQLIPDALETTEATETTQPTQPTETTETTQTTQTTQTTETTQATPPPTNPLFDDSRRTFTEFQADEIVGKDSRLAWIAKKRYGEKALWVFIYEANREVVKDPNNLPANAELLIPDLTERLQGKSPEQITRLIEEIRQTVE